MNKPKIIQNLSFIGTETSEIRHDLTAIAGKINTINEAVDTIRDELNEDPPIEPVIIFDPPVRIGKILSNGGAHILNGYSSWEYFQSGRIRMWYLWQRINLDNSKTNFFLSCMSDDGLSGHWQGIDVQNPLGNPLQGYGPTSSKQFKGFYYHVYNKPAVNQLCEKRFFKSATGHTWTEYQTAKVWKLGEDHNLFVIKQGTPDEEMIILVRPQLPDHPLSNGKRHICIMRTKDGIVWTDPVPLFTSTDFNEQYYSMSVCEVKNDLYYGCLNVYNKSTEQVKMRIMASTDLMNWTLLGNMPLPANVQVQWGSVSFNPYKNEIDILSLESENDHAGRGNPLNRFYLALNKVKVNGL